MFEILPILLIKISLMSRNGEFPVTIFYLALYVVSNFDDLSSFRTNSAKRCLSILSGEIAYSAQNSEIDIIHAKYESQKVTRLIQEQGTGHMEVKLPVVHTVLLNIKVIPVV